MSVDTYWLKWLSRTDDAIQLISLILFSYTQSLEEFRHVHDSLHLKLLMVCYVINYWMHWWVVIWFVYTDYTSEMLNYSRWEWCIILKFYLRFPKTFSSPNFVYFHASLWFCWEKGSSRQSVCFCKRSRTLSWCGVLKDYTIVKVLIMWLIFQIGGHRFYCH